MRKRALIFFCFIISFYLNAWGGSYRQSNFEAIRNYEEYYTTCPPALIPAFIKDWYFQFNIKGNICINSDKPDTYYVNSLANVYDISGTKGEFLIKPSYLGLIIPVPGPTTIVYGNIYLDGNSCDSSFTVNKKNDESYKLEYKAKEFTRYFGNESVYLNRSWSYTITVDDEGPNTIFYKNKSKSDVKLYVSNKKNISFFKDNSYTEADSKNFNTDFMLVIYDKHTGIKSSDIKIEDPFGTSILDIKDLKDIDSFKISKDLLSSYANGTYPIYITSYDHLDNYTTTYIGDLLYDTIAPTFHIDYFSYSQDDAGNLYLNTSLYVNDNFSVESVLVNGIECDLVEGKVFSSLKVERGNKFTVKVQATDEAGNESYIDYSFNIPKKVSGELISSENDNDNIINKIRINCSSCDSYKNFYLKRHLFDNNGKEIYYKEWKNDFDFNFDDEILVTNELLNAYDEESYCIVDKIPILSGLGHKQIEYEIISELSPNKNFTRDWVLPSRKDDIKEVLLTNKIFMFNSPVKDFMYCIEGKDGAKYYFNKDGQQVSENFDVISPVDIVPEVGGFVKISVRLRDNDCEYYNITLNEKISEQLQMCIDKHRISGLMRTGVIGESATQWYTFEEPIYLDYNNKRNFFITIKEMSTGSLNSTDVEYVVTTNTSVFALDMLENTDLIKVSGGSFNEKGIFARPYESFTLSIDDAYLNENKECTWNFGDGSKLIKNETTVTKAYLQNENRTGCVSNYILQFSSKDRNNRKISQKIEVNIVDTQIGELLGNETWRGLHNVYGIVVVPKGITLTIESQKSNNEDTKVIFNTSNVNSEMAGLNVYGHLNVIGSEAKVIQFVGIDCLSRWQGIKVYGSGNNVNVKYAKFYGANRALAFKNTGNKINLEHLVFDSNFIGLHAYGSCGINLENCCFMNNIWYGIKEDYYSDNNLPYVNFDETCSFINNSVDYYNAKENIFGVEK